MTAYCATKTTYGGGEKPDEEKKQERVGVVGEGNRSISDDDT
jgi:hypothetical protein